MVIGAVRARSGAGSRVRARSRTTQRAGVLPRSYANCTVAPSGASLKPCRTSRKSTMGDPWTRSCCPELSSTPQAGSDAPKTTPPPARGSKSWMVFWAAGESVTVPRPPAAQRRIGCAPCIWYRPAAKSHSPSADQATLNKFPLSTPVVSGAYSGTRSSPERTSTRVESSNPTATRPPSGENTPPAGSLPPGACRLARR